MAPSKVAIFIAVVCLYAYAAAEEAKEDEENVIKVYKRLIPADVLRGKFFLLSKIRTQTVKDDVWNVFEFRKDWC